MEFTEILHMMHEYGRLTPEEVQNIIKPIIKGHEIDMLCCYLNRSKSHIYRMCKALYVRNGEKPPFEIYAKLIALKERDKHEAQN